MHKVYIRDLVTEAIFELFAWLCVASLICCIATSIYAFKYYTVSDFMVIGCIPFSLTLLSVFCAEE